MALDEPASQEKHRSECGELEFADNVLLIQPDEQAVSSFDKAEELQNACKKAHDSLGG
tara:strand:- start:1265 stop:1438 length:174 start_codon:yes stop_codon:yes gene_type:complete